VRPVAAEPSGYGSFAMTVERLASGLNPICHVTFLHASTGKATPLFDVPDCIGRPGTDDDLGVSIVAAQGRIGSLLFPLRGDGGDEFHVMEIATARGGNAVPGNDYWAVVVTADAAWSTSGPFASAANLSVAQALSADGQSSLRLEDPPSTTAAGARYTASRGMVTKEDLAMLPSAIVSKKTQTFVGELSGGAHYTNFRPSIHVGQADIVIDDDGSCATLSDVASEGGTVRLIVEVSKWSDGRTTVRCVGVGR
jgi:hypothetical protein